MTLYKQSQCNMFEVSTLDTRITNKLKFIQIKVIYCHIANLLLNDHDTWETLFWHDLSSAATLRPVSMF